MKLPVQVQEIDNIAREKYEKTLSRIISANLMYMQVL